MTQPGLEQAERKGDQVTIPERMFVAMSWCYFGDGPRFREQPEGPRGTHTAVLASPSGPPEPNRSELSDEGKLAPPMVLRTKMPGVPRGVAPGAPTRQMNVGPSLFDEPTHSSVRTGGGR